MRFDRGGQRIFAQHRPAGDGALKPTEPDDHFVRARVAAKHTEAQPQNLRR
jgi:hypothetical protein